MARPMGPGEYTKLQIPDPQGYSLYVCRRCGAVVTGKTQGQHNAWHLNVDAAIEHAGKSA